MSISDRIVVMKEGTVQQIGLPQEVYDDPANQFVAQFLGTPPINVFRGAVRGGRLYIGEDDVLAGPGVPDGEVSVGVRPEGFVLRPDGPLVCRLGRVEVMGRDVSVVSAHDAAAAPTIRSIISAENLPDIGGAEVRFALKPAKVRIFSPETGERIRGTEL
jgi:multiple sugar transport system ATP-binding protein